MAKMTLRELINRLDQLSHNGLNDGMVVVIAPKNDDASEFDISGACIHHYESSDEMYDYVKIESRQLKEFVDSI